MIKGKWIAASVIAATLGCSLAPAAHASEAGESTVVGSGVAFGKVKDPIFNLSGPGTLTVRAYDVGVAGSIVAPPLEGLSFSVYNSSSIFSHAGAGELSMDVSGPGMYFLNLQAIPSLQSRFQSGLVSWIATFDADQPAPVPLPASVWLLIAGLAWATGMQRKRAKLARVTHDSPSWGSADALAH